MKKEKLIILMAALALMLAAVPGWSQVSETARAFEQSVVQRECDPNMPDVEDQFE